MTALSDPIAAPPRRWQRPLVLQGAVTVALGVGLIGWPGHSLTLVAVLAGVALCATGLFEIASAGHPGLTRPQRVGAVLVGLLALVAGGLAIARPEGTIRALATVVGLYLVITGVAAALLWLSVKRRGASLPVALMAVVAGIVLLVWPGISAGVFAVVTGLFLLLAGALELWAGLTRHPDTAANK
jgi:uncharacterized membrane protein HdeD (DUF308 family)